METYDWSYYLIRAEHELRNAAENLNRNKLSEADDQLAQVLNHCRMARIYIANQENTSV
jgi:hypothetical protein